MENPRRPLRSRAPLTLALVVALAISLGACGDDAEESDPSSGPAAGSTTFTPPEDGKRPGPPDKNADPEAVECTGEPRGTFDATAIVGMPIAEAEAVAEDDGCSVRVVERDGEGLASTLDFRSDRVNVAVEDGSVTEIVDIG